MSSFHSSMLCSERWNCSKYSKLQFRFDFRRFIWFNWNVCQFALSSAEAPVFLTEMQSQNLQYVRCELFSCGFGVIIYFLGASRPVPSADERILMCDKFRKLYEYRKLTPAIGVRQYNRGNPRFHTHIQIKKNEINTIDCSWTIECKYYYADSPRHARYIICLCVAAFAYVF